jgi:hypothetical protein
MNQSYSGIPWGAGLPVSLPEPVPTQIGFKLTPDDVSLLQIGMAPGESIHQAARRILMTTLSTPNLWYFAWHLDAKEVENGQPTKEALQAQPSKAFHRFVVLESSKDRLLGFIQTMERGVWHFFTPAMQSRMTSDWSNGRGYFTFDKLFVWKIVGFPLSGNPDGPIVMCELLRIPRD